MRLNSLALKCFYGVLALIVGYFYFIHIKYAYSFPYDDEYRTISTVIIDYLNAEGFFGKLKVLFVNENESLQLFLKLANIIFYELSGEIQYNYLAYMGQLSLLGFPLVVYLLNRKSDTLWFDIGLTVLIIFNLQYYVLTFKHDISFYYLLGLLGVTFSLYFWVKGHYKWALLFFLLGVFNNTSSVLVLPVMVLDYITSARNIKLKYLLIGGAGFVLLILFFYTIYPYLFWLPEGWEITTKTFFIILGNVAEFKYGATSEKPYLFLGPAYLLFILVTFYFYLFKRNSRSEKVRFYALMAIYFFVTISAIAVKRGHLYHHFFTLLDPRYKIFTFSLLLFLLLFWGEMLRLNKKIKWGLIVVFLCYNVLYMFDSQDYRRFLNQGAKLNSIALKNGHDILGPVHINFAVRVYNELDSLGLAPQEDPYARSLYDYMSSASLEGAPELIAEVKTERIFDSDRYHTIQRIIAESENKESFIFLKSEDNVMLFPLDFYLKNPRVEVLKTGHYVSNKFYCNLFLSVLKEGEYSLGLLTKEKDGSFSVKVYPEKTIIDSKVTNLTDEFPSEQG